MTQPLQQQRNRDPGQGAGALSGARVPKDSAVFQACVLLGALELETEESVEQAPAPAGGAAAGGAPVPQESVAGAAGGGGGG